MCWTLSQTTKYSVTRVASAYVHSMYNYNGYEDQYLTRLG